MAAAVIGSSSSPRGTGSHASSSASPISSGVSSHHATINGKSVSSAPIINSQGISRSGSRDYLDELYNSNVYNYERYEEANRYNRSLYNDALDWYERMQNTSIQRMVEDMKRAGINPVLAGRYAGYNVAMPNVPYNNNVPYIDLGSYGSAMSSMYATDMKHIDNMENLSVSQKNVLKQCETQVFNTIQQVEGSKNVAEIYTSMTKYVTDVTNDLTRELEGNRLALQNVLNWRDNIFDSINIVLKEGASALFSWAERPSLFGYK